MNKQESKSERDRVSGEHKSRGKSDCLKEKREIEEDVRCERDF